MELNEFVKESLLQIFDGISEAQKIVLEKNEGIINPVDDRYSPPENRSLVPAVHSDLSPGLLAGLHYSIDSRAQSDNPSQSSTDLHASSSHAACHDTHCSSFQKYGKTHVVGKTVP